MFTVQYIIIQNLHEFITKNKGNIFYKSLSYILGAKINFHVILCILKPFMQIMTLLVHFAVSFV